MTFAIAEPLNPRAGWHRATVLLRKGYGTKHREFFPRQLYVAMSESANELFRKVSVV